MNKSVFSGGHASSDRWAVCYATETADEGSGKSQIFFVDFEAPGAWGHTEWNNAIASSCDFRHGPGGRNAAVFMSDQGLVSISNSDGSWVEEIPNAGLLEEFGRGYMSHITQIGDVLFACGAGSQLYARHSGGEWVDVVPETTLAEQGRNSGNMGQILSGEIDLRAAVTALQQRKDFNFLAEGSEGDVLIGGSFGLIAQVKQGIYRDFQLKDEPEIVFLEAMQDDSSIVAVGTVSRSVTVYKGNLGDGLHRVGKSGETMSATAAVFWKDTLYIGTILGLFRFRDNVFSKVSLSRNKTEPVVALSSVGEVLWIVTSDMLYCLDKNELEAIPKP